MTSEGKEGRQAIVPSGRGQQEDLEKVYFFSPAAARAPPHPLFHGQGANWILKDSSF